MADLPQNQTSTEQSQTATAPSPKGAPSSAQWLREITAAEKHLEKFRKAGRMINLRFLDKREAGEEDAKKYNLFTTNTLILQSTLYARFPKPMVEREFNDQDDDIARVAGTMIERVISVKERDDFDCAMKHVVQDRLVPGLGQVFFRYEPTIVKQEVPAQVDPFTQQEISPATSYDRLVNEEVMTDYVFWEDFLYSPARIWKQVRWVGRIIKMNKEDVEKRFGPEIANQLSFTKGHYSDSDRESNPLSNDPILYAIIYEIWDKRTRTVIWVTKGFEYCLDVKPDPFKLLDFFPCPQPLMALTSTTDFIPRADYLMTQDQYIELDDLNNRITILEKAVKVVGVYDGASEELKRIFSENLENKLIGLTSFRQFAEAGGFKGMIDWIPIEMVVKAIEALRIYRQDLIAQIYELTGISDIIRGATKASETLGAQELKAQYAGVRFTAVQQTVSTFVEESMEIKMAIIRNKFQPETIRARSNIDRTPDAPLADQALALIKDPMFGYRVKVYADTMAAPEFNAERDSRMLFLRSLSEVLTAAAPLMQQTPDAGVYILKIIQWAAAGFRVGRTIESVLDQAIAAIEKRLKQPPTPPPPPTPKEIADTENVLSQADLNTAKTQQVIVDTAVTLKTPIEDPNKKPDTPPTK